MKVGKKWDRVTVFAGRLFFWAMVAFCFLFILTIASCNRGYGCPNAF